MSAPLIYYLDSIKSSLRLAPSEEKEVIRELETHIEDRLQELTEAGMSEEEAEKTCLGLLGSAKLAAHQIYEAHSQGTWKQALLASMPHLLFGLLFMLNWWQHLGWLSGVLAIILLTTIYGWLRGKPSWVFPCLGYSLLPVLAGGILLLYLPRGWSLLALPFYFALALWWLGYIVVQTTKRDWLFSSLMLLPVPILAGWFLAVSPEARLNEYTMLRVQELAPWIALSFLSLALTIGVFIRLRQRRLKTALLVITGLLTVTLITYYANGKITLIAFLVLILATWGVFLIPPLLERRIRAGRHKLINLESLGWATGQGFNAEGKAETKGGYRH